MDNRSDVLFLQCMSFVIGLIGEWDVGIVEAAWLKRRQDISKRGFASNYQLIY